MTNPITENEQFLNSTHDLNSLTNDDLLERTAQAVQIERTSTAEVVRCFREISERKLFLELGFANLYEMATKQFGYCAGSAMRRINSMRLIQDIPMTEKMIESGELSLTVAAEVQSFFYAEKKEARPYSQNAKIELIETCLNKSKREVEIELAKRNPEREKRESIRPISEDQLRVSLTISTDLNEKLNRLRDLLSHSYPNISTENLIEKLAELGLDKFDSVRKAERAEKRKPSSKRDVASTRSSSNDGDQNLDVNLPPPAESGVKPRTRYVTAEEIHQMTKHDDGLGCAFVNPRTGRRCGSKRYLERDHIEPYSHGGSNTAENLRWLCSAHNKIRWENRSGSRVRAKTSAV